MLLSNQPWFFPASLRAQFSLDILEALDFGRINERQSRWLQSIVAEAENGRAKPRVDQLLYEGAALEHAELSGALLISDETSTLPDVYLRTALYGLEQFDNRQRLITALASRFTLNKGDISRVEFQRLEGEAFEALTLSVIDQQALQLGRLTECFLQVPGLLQAFGQTLQEQVDAQMPGNAINVFTHIVHIKQIDNATQVATTVASQTLVDAAMCAFTRQPLPAGLRHQWLDSDGREMTESQARPWLPIMAGVAGGLVAVYENLLKSYWASPAGTGITLRDQTCQLFTERFRQHVLQSRHEAKLSTSEFFALQSLFIGDNGWIAELKVLRLSLQIGSQEPVKLAGIFLIEFITEQLPDLLLYSAEKGLQRFTSLDAITIHYANIHERAHLFGHISLNDYLLLGAQGLLHLRTDPLDKTPLNNVTDSVIGLQKRNLAVVLKRSFTSAEQATLAVREALDIRNLIDPRLIVAGDAVHWNDGLASSARSWSEFSSPSRVAGLDIPLSGQVAESALLPWSNYLRDIRLRIDAIFKARPTVANCARTVLNRYFSILQGAAVDTRGMWFRADDNSVVSLQVLLVECVSGLRDATALQDCEVHLDTSDSVYPQYLSWLTPLLLNHVLNRAQQGFAHEYSHQVRNFYSGQLFAVGSSVLPANASSLIKTGLLRLELNIQRTIGRVSDHGLDMLQQILDRPVFALREPFADEAVEIHIPALVYDSAKPPVPLTNVLVLQQPLLGDARPLLWSGVRGVQEFDSLEELQLELCSRLEYPGSRERWLQLIGENDWEKIRGALKRGDKPITVSLARLEESFLERIESDELNRQCQGIDATYQTAQEWQVDAELFEDMMTAMALDSRTRNLVDMLSGELEATLLVGGMPKWLQDASVGDLLLFRLMLVRFRQLYTSRQEIPEVLSLEEYAANQLTQRLQKDFPDVQLDPDATLITLTRYTPALGAVGEVPSSIPAATNVISESLTRYAINRFLRFQDASLSISSEDATQLPVALDALYIQELVRTVDVGAGYVAYLKKIFSEADSGYAERRGQFIAMAPYALLLTALTVKLRGGLSYTGYMYIENIVDMPDGIARLPVNGQNLEFGRLGLVCAEGYSADLVSGVFLIRPAANAPGLWILHATADVDFLFKEYAGQSEFLADLQTSEKLQAMLLERLDPTVRFVYERGGFMQPHLSWMTGGFTDLSSTLPEPVQVKVVPLQENMLECLFSASQEVLLLIAKKYSVTTAEADSAGSQLLMLLGLENALMFLPGKLGRLVSLWQGQDLLHASLGSAAEDNWGQATAEFLTALAVLIASRQQTDEGVAAYSTYARDEIVPRWHDPQLQVDLSERLKQFEVHDVSLNTLERDQALNIFRSSISLKQYAAVYGKVYQLKKLKVGWCVTRGDNEGPRVTLSEEKQWVLDTALGSRRDGGALTKLRSAQTDLDVNDVLLVEARGMPEIQRLYPRKAELITEAHRKAKQYLDNALHNLTIPKAHSTIDPRAARIITEFFGVKSLSNVSVLPVKQAFYEIYRALLDPDFSPRSSERYVVGSNKLGYEENTAFNFANDPFHRIFFSERYFIAPFVQLKTRHLREGSFNADTHYRAAILIHELSHIACDTHDIAYLDSTAPYLDLLQDTGAYRARLKREHQKAQYGLSHRTPRDELFRMEEDGMWRDLKTEDSDAKRTILRVTGADDLEAARDSFLHDTRIRSKLMLSNADSVALLVTLLGRERFLPVPVPL